MASRSFGQGSVVCLSQGGSNGSCGCCENAGHTVLQYMYRLYHLISKGLVPESVIVDWPVGAAGTEMTACSNDQKASIMISKQKTTIFQAPTLIALCWILLPI